MPRGNVGKKSSKLITLMLLLQRENAHLVSLLEQDRNGLGLL